MYQAIPRKKGIPVAGSNPAGYSLDSLASFIYDFGGDRYFTRSAALGAWTESSFETLFTFTGSNGTVINQFGLVEAAVTDKRRRSYDPVTLAARGILIEEARTNLVLRYDNFGVTWAAVGTPTRTAAGKTQGIVNLDLIGDDDPLALEGYTQTVTFTGNATKSISCLVSKGNAVSSVIRLRDTTAAANRLLAAITWSGAVPSVAMTTGTFEGAVDYGNGIYRLKFVTTSVTAANTNSLECYPATDAALDVTAIGNIYVGGVQAENGTFATSIIATTTATVARTIDLCTRALGTEYSATANTILSGCRPATLLGSGVVWQIDDGTANNRAVYNASLNIGTVVTGGVTQANFDVAGESLNRQKSALAYKLNDFAFSKDGSAALTDVSGTVPTVTTLKIGKETTTSFVMNGWIDLIVGYPSRLSDANLASITT